ncbi:hypothetical protein ABK040_010834 [Willaertia magna]
MFDLANFAINNTISNDTNVCHISLIEKGFKSQYGVCDDYVSAKVVSGIFLVFHFSLVVVSLSGLLYQYFKIYKANKLKEINHLTARGLSLLILPAVWGLIFSFIVLMRIMINRKVFPCFIFMLTYFNAVPIMGLPIILRTIRLITLMKINEWKVVIANGHKKIITDGTQKIEMTESNVQDVNKTNNQSMNQDIAVDNSLIILTENEVKALGNSNIKNEIIQKYSRYIKVLTLFTNNNFALITFFAVISVHSFLFFICGLINDLTTSSNFVVGSKIYTFSNGCGLGTNSQIYFGTAIAFYLIITFFTVAVTFFIKRDTLFVKFEIIPLVINWLVIGALYLIPPFFSVISKLTDYYFPWVVIILIAIVIDTIISCTIPVFIYYPLSQRRRLISDSTNAINGLPETSQPKEENKMEKLLKDPSINKMLVEFATRSYCPEDILCWNSIQLFKKANKKKRAAILTHIYNDYLRLGATMEINVNRAAANNFQEIRDWINNYKSNKDSSTFPEDNLVENLEFFVLHNMLDIFDRFTKAHGSKF